MAVTPTSSASSSIDPKTTARSMFNGDVKDFQKLSVEEQIAMNPSVRRIKQNIADVETKISKSGAKVTAYEKLRTTIQNLRDTIKFLRKPANVDDNAFERKSAAITTSDNQSVEYISVDASPGAINAKFKVNVRQIATNSTITIGTANLTLATAVNAAIQGAGTTAGAVAAALAAAGGVDATGIPTNPYAKSLFQLAYVAQQSGADIATLRAQAAEIYAQMQQKPISAGYQSLDTACVDNAAGGMLQSGSYALLSMAGGADIAKMIRINIHDANIILNAIDGIATDPPSVADIQAAIDAVSGTMLGGYSAGTHLPNGSILGAAVANAAYASANGGATALEDVKVAAMVAATANIVNEAAKAVVDGLPSGSDVADNLFTKNITNAIAKASKQRGATLATIEAAAEAAYASFVANCTVTFNDGDTLQTVIDKINATSSYSAVVATTIQNGDGSYLLHLSSEETGSDFEIQIRSADLATDEYGALVAHVEKQNSAAQNAIALLDGYLIQQNSNTLNNYLKGVSITLKTPNTNSFVSQTVTVEPNTDAAIEYIGKLMTSYNQLSIFIAQQTAIDPNTKLPLDDAVLSKESYISQIKSMLPRILTTAIGYGDGGYNSMQDLGIKLEEAQGDTENGIPAHQELTLDIEKLKKTITTNYDQVRRIFEFDYTSSNPALTIVGNDTLHIGGGNFRVTIHREAHDLGPAGDKQVAIDILSEDGVVTSTEYYMLSDTHGNGNYAIICDSVGSKLSGMVLNYKSAIDPAGSINVVYHQGIADGIFSFIDQYADDSSTSKIGSISTTEQNIAMGSGNLYNEKTRLEQELAKVTEREAARIGAINQIAMKAKFDSEMMEEYLKMQSGERR